MDSSDLDPHVIHTPLGSYESAPFSPKRHLDWFSHFCVHNSKDSQCFSVGQTTPEYYPFPLGDLDPCNYIWLLGCTQLSPPIGILIGSAIFAGLMT